MTARIRRWILVSASIIVIFLVSATVWYGRYEQSLYKRAYVWLTPGATKAEVLRRFGKPGEIEACDSPAPSWDGSPADGMPCVEKFRYFSRISIGVWEVGFDKNGKVVSKSYLSSP
jgi:hypothetical protein